MGMKDLYVIRSNICLMLTIIQTMNKVLIVDASESDCRLMSGLLVKHGYEPIAVDNMEAAKEAVVELPPGPAAEEGRTPSGVLETKRTLPKLVSIAPTMRATMATTITSRFFCSRVLTS